MQLERDRREQVRYSGLLQIVSRVSLAVEIRSNDEDDAGWNSTRTTLVIFRLSAASQTRKPELLPEEQQQLAARLATSELREFATCNVSGVASVSFDQDRQAGVRNIQLAARPRSEQAEN